jgi:uncharacterized membrane protein YcaP (DUF421 family)
VTVVEGSAVAEASGSMHGFPAALTSFVGRAVAGLRLHSRVVRMIDHPHRVLVAGGELEIPELARAGLTAAYVYALLREKASAGGRTR